MLKCFLRIEEQEKTIQSLLKETKQKVNDDAVLENINNSVEYTKNAENNYTSTKNLAFGVLTTNKASTSSLENRDFDENPTTTTEQSSVTEDITYSNISSTSMDDSKNEILDFTTENLDFTTSTPNGNTDSENFDFSEETTTTFNNLELAQRTSTGPLETQITNMNDCFCIDQLQKIIER